MNTHSPLGFLADFSVSDPLTARRFMELSRALPIQGERKAHELEALLKEWENNREALSKLAERFPVLKRLLPLAGQIG